MKLKYFIIALVAMLSCFTSKALAQEVILVHNVEELKQVLATMSPAESRSVGLQRAVAEESITTVTLSGTDFDKTIVEAVLSSGASFALDLNGHNLTAEWTLQAAKLIIRDSKKTGAFIGSITTQTGTSLVVESGNIISNGGAAIVNGGVLTIDGGAVIGKITDNGGEITVNADYNMALLADVATMQKALNVAIDGQGVKFAQDIEGNLTVPQSPGTKITVDGDNKTMKGYIVVDGKSYDYPTTGTTIKNVHFDASAISLDASVNLGDGGNTTRYTNNVTVDNCTFKGDIAKAAVKSYQGGCKNLVVSNCEAEGMLSLLQAVNIDGITIKDCTANTKNGINLNSSANVTVENNTINVQGYAVRVGVTGGESGKIELEGNTLTSQCADGDAVVVLRGTAPAKVDLTMEKNAVSGTTHISGHAANTKMELDANYWDGKKNPVVTGSEVKVNSYYETTDFSAAPTRNPMGGAIVGYTSSDAIWGEAWSNASASYVVKVIDANGNVMGTTSLNNIGGIMNGKNVAPTWNIKFDAASNTDEYWTMSWTKAPTITYMPVKVQLWVDGEKVSEGDVKRSAADDLHKIVAATTDADGRILSCQTSLENAVKAGNNVAILVPGTYSVPAGKDLTVTGAVDGVEFGPIAEPNMGMKNYTFNNVTFNYAAGSLYKGLQYAGNMVYNNCTFNGQVFLYGQSETFNKCTFNQNSSDAYNVWTYSAKEVAFNECTFNSAGKSVLIYHESATVFNNVAVAKSTFNASQAVEGKAAIEMDASLTAGIKLTIDDATTTTGFAAGNVSGNALWNNKKGNADDANNDITVVVAGETVLAPIYVAKIGETGHRTFQEAINAVKNGETITLLQSCDEEVAFTQTKEVSFVLDGNSNTYTGKINITARAGKDAPSTLVIKNFNFKTDAISHDFIKSVETNYYPNNITISNCNFEGTSDINTADYAVVAVRLKSANNIKIENCTGTGLHSFLQNTAGWNMQIDNADVTNSLSGFAMGTIQGTTIQNCDLTVNKSGIRFDAQLNNNAVISDNNISAFIPVVVRKASVSSEMTFDGTNTMTASNTDGLWCAIGTSEYETNDQMPTAATGKVKVTLNDTGLSAEGVYGNFVVASIGNVKFNTLAEAVAAVEDGGTITLIANETFTKTNRTHNSGTWYDGLYYVGDKSFTIDLGGFTIGQDGSVNDYLLNFKNSGSKANTITLKNGTVDAGTAAFCALCTSSSQENQLTINTENLALINNISNGSTVKLRGGAILNVKEGTVITGKNSYLGIECVASTVNIYDGAEIYMNGTSSYNGCLVGACAAGTVNVYGGYGKGVKGGFIAMTSGGTINIEGGEWIANTDGTVGNNSNLYVLTAQSNKYESGFAGPAIINVTGGTFRGGMDAWVLNNHKDEKAELNIKGGNFNADPTKYVEDDYIAVENNGVWNVVKAAAKIGTTGYATLEAAFKAATSGCTIEILSDVTVDYNWDARYTGGKFTVPVTINGKGKTIKFTASVNDNNYQAPFRFEADATVKNLTIDMSEATDNRFRAISSKGNLTVDGCKFIGKDETLNCRAIIFGEGAGANVGNLAISIANSEFINWKRGITDNENAQDVKTVTITGNTLTDAGVGVSAKETVTFTGNTVAGAYVNIKSYTAGNKLAVTATGNTLEANTDGAYNVIDAGGVVNAEGFNVVAKGNNFNGYTGTDRIWGEVWGNARESFVIKVLDANGNVMGTSSLNNIDGIIDGDVNVTWSILFNAPAPNPAAYWSMEWTTAPTLNNMPAKVELWVDGTRVSGGDVVLNGPDNLDKINVIVTDADGKVTSCQTTVANALAAAKDGETVNLLWKEGQAPLAMNGSVFGKDVTIKGTAKVDWSKGFLFVGRGGEGNATVTFDGANLTSASNNASTGIHVSGREKNTSNKYDGTLVIKNSTIELDYLINKGAMTLDKAALTVKNGCAIGGRPATETENGQDATATISLTNESKLVVNNHNGMGLGYEAIGVMNVDATSTFETTQSFLVTAKGTMNLAGTAKVEGTLTNNGAINMIDKAATLTSSECGNVTTDIADHKVVYANGTYNVVAKKYVAIIDENRKFETFKEALDAIQDGETIKLVADCGENVTIQQKKGVSFTVDGADKTYTGTITVKGDGATNGNNTETLTFQNIKFVAKAGAYAITAAKGTHARNITVDGCTFKGTATSYGIRVRNGWNYAVKNTTVDGLRSFFNASENLSGLTVENVTVTNTTSAFNAAYGFGKATFKNVNISVSENGIWIKNQNAFNMTLENCSIAAAKPIQVEEYGKFTNSITLNGTNNLVAANDGNWLTIVDAPAVDATFKVLANDLGLDLSKVEGLAAYAKNAQRSYGSNKFQNVTSATLDGDVVTLVADIALDTKNYTTQVDGYAVLFNVKGKAVTFDLNGKKIAVNASAADLGGKMLLGVFSADIEGDFTITDNSAESTGIVEVNVNDANVYSVFVSENAGDKTKSGKMTVNAGNFTTIGKVSNAMIFADTDKVITINGGKFICDGATTTSTNPWIVNTFGNNERQVVINGGTFNADINHQHRPFEVYVPKNLAVKSNGDATWTIVSAQAYVTEMLGATVDESGNYSHEVGYATLKEAFTAVEEGETVTVLPGEVTENVKLPAELANVTITAEEGAVLKDMTISAADGNSYNYVGLTFDGLTFDNSRIVMTGWRNGEETIKDLTVTNCTFKNLDDNTNTAPVHINKDAAEAVNGFTFTNNVIDGATGDKKSGVYAQLTGKVVFTDNVINNVAFRPYVIQLTTNDGIDDELIVTGNTFSGSAVGRAQGLGSDAAGTDAVNLVVSNNIFKGITDAQQICYWSFNPETTTADLSKNYYDIDIVKNPGKIYYNAAATGVEDLLAMNVYPFYTALNEDGTINTASLKEAPVAKVIYPVGNSEYADGAVVYYDTMLEAVPNTSNCPRLEGATIQLIRDASAKGLRLMENGMVLDLNGKTYTITEATGSKGTETSGFQIRPEVTTGATIQNGTINVAEGTNVVWLFNSYATDFVLNNVVVDCANLNWNYGEQCKVLVNRKGDNVQLTGNTEFQNFDSNVAPNAMSIEGTMTIGDDVKLGNMTIEMATTTTINGPQGLNVVVDNSDYAVIWNNGVYSTTYSDYISEFTINDGEYTEFEFDCLNGVANVGTLTYKRKIYDKDLYDLFVPFEIPVSELMQLGFQVFYINDFRSFDSSGREQLVLESVLIEDGILRANHPYLFRFVGDEIPTEGLVLTLENAVLYSTNSENHTVVDCSSAYKKFEIKGTYNTMSSDELNGSLILGAGNKWGPIVGGYSLKPFRLTLTISNRDGSPVKIEEPVAVRLFGVDAETAIDDVEMTYSDENTIFDLQGRRVLSPVKGNLYIINGKKVVY